MIKRKKQTKLLAEPTITEGERSHEEIMVIIVALMLAMLLAALDQTIVSTALPTIASDLNGLNKLSWVATAYLLTSAIVTPIYGKLGDMFGRKKIFQIAILIFLAGSVLCGLSQNMNELVIFRAVQGLGGGGLISLALAVIGDIVPPRQRGRYQGYFGGVFTISSVAGPLLGGFFTDSLSWRWIFYINLPLGLIALAAITARLHLPVHKVKHRFDYVGTAILSAGLVCLLLALTWGGTQYAWGSDIIIGLLAAFGIALAGFIGYEKRVPEPVIPLSLFSNGIFRVSSLLALLTGLVMLGTIIFLPEYQQIVHGYSATKSGLLQLPLVAGLFVASLMTGRLTSKLGRYRQFPIIGSVLIALGLFLFSHVTVDTSEVTLSIWMFITGFGIGMLMPILTLAVQNSVDQVQMGVATSTVTFFRSIGSSIGTAVFGVILTSRLTHHLQELAPQAAGQAGNVQSSAARIAHLPAAIREPVLHAFALSFHDVFLAAIPFALVSFVIALFLKDVPLRGTAKKETTSQAVSPTAV